MDRSVLARVLRLRARHRRPAVPRRGRRDREHPPPPEARAPDPVPDGFEDWLQRLCEPEPHARYQLAADAAFALSTICQGFQSNKDTIKAAKAMGIPVPDDHTTTLAFDAQILEDFDDAQTRQRGGLPSPHRLPPLPARWQRRRGLRPNTRLLGAGLGLYGLRRIPMIARVEERDALWRALKSVKTTGKARVVVIHGPAGAGKTRLGEWLLERAHELGAASVMHAAHGRPSGPSDGVPGMLGRSAHRRPLRRPDQAAGDGRVRVLRLRRDPWR